MICVDTNIIVRFLTGDDTTQYETAYSIFKDHEVFIPDTVVLETEWVLRFAYQFSPEKICHALVNLFGLKNVHLSNRSLIAQALEWHKNGLDFADALRLSQCQAYDTLYTFDKKFAAKANALTRCAVTLP